jgi:FkbM family methyltransferase
VKNAFPREFAGLPFAGLPDLVTRMRMPSSVYKPWQKFWKTLAQPYLRSRHISLSIEDSLKLLLVPASFYFTYKGAKEQRRGEPELSILRDIVPANCVAIDVGANRGMYSYALSRIARRVEAFEPNPDMARFAAAMLGRRARVHACALAEYEGAATLYIPKTTDDVSLHLLASLGNVHPTETSKVEVRVTKLDNFDFDDVGFIKIDVEGGEMQVIEGGQHTISRNRPNLLIEMLGLAQEDQLGRIEKIKQRFDYDAWIVVGNAKLDACHALRDRGPTLRTRNVLFTSRQVRSRT